MLYELIFLKEGLNWKKRVDKFINQPNTYVHFSDLPKLGINPQSKYKTPIGIYAYPFKLNKLSDFAQERKYMIVFKAKNPSKVLDPEIYEHNEHEINLNKLRQKYGLEAINDLEALSPREANDNSYAGYLWYMTWKLSNGNIILWNKIWREVLG